MNFLLLLDEAAIYEVEQVESGHFDLGRRVL
jgi:hypothetical protein